MISDNRSASPIMLPAIAIKKSPAFSVHRNENYVTSTGANNSSKMARSSCSPEPAHSAMFRITEPKGTPPNPPPHQTANPQHLILILLSKIKKTSEETVQICRD